MGTCRSQYGAAIGFIGADGTPQMLPMVHVPTDVSAGFAVDALGRVWVGTRRGVAVREGRWPPNPGNRWMRPIALTLLPTHSRRATRQ